MNATMVFIDVYHLTTWETGVSTLKFKVIICFRCSMKQTFNKNSFNMCVFIFFILKNSIMSRWIAKKWEAYWIKKKSSRAWSQRVKTPKRAIWPATRTATTITKTTRTIQRTHSNLIPAHRCTLRHPHQAYSHFYLLLYSPS